MKRGGPLKRKTPLRAKGSSDTALIKDSIQALVRAIVVIRDGGCILRNTPEAGECNGYRKDGQLILQADHLITRGNAATFADTRLIVCLCKGHHGGFKKWHKEQYDAIVRTLLSPERLSLWARCEQDSWRPLRTGIYDWRLQEAALKQELTQIAHEHPESL